MSLNYKTLEIIFHASWWVILSKLEACCVDSIREGLIVHGHDDQRESRSWV